jgi:16S rRNA (uracil1498-N3)-methyltransferase
VEAGQQYEISDNERVYLAEVALATKKQVRFLVMEELEGLPPPARVWLFLSLVKFDRLELVIEKATELGVERVAPVLARRSEKGLEQAAVKRLARWRKIAVEASQQSRRVRLPLIEPVMRFQDAVSTMADRRYFLEEMPGAPPILARILETPPRAGEDVVALLAGPEGGWVDSEREMAGEAGWEAVSLGPQVLRSETAAIAALAVVMSAWAHRE